MVKILRRWVNANDVSGAADKSKIYLFTFKILLITGIFYLYFQ